MPFELFGDFPVSSSWIGTVSAAPVSNTLVAVIIHLQKPTQSGTDAYWLTVTANQWLGIRVDILANQADQISIGAEIGRLMKQRKATPLT